MMKATRLTAALMLMLLLAGCGPAKPPTPAPEPPDKQAVQPQRPELTAPFEGALTALKAMNEAGRGKEFAKAQQEFQRFRSHWATIREKLRAEDPRMEAHIEDGAVELDHEFTKPEAEIRVYELDEETVKLGRLLSKAAVTLGVPIRADLVQNDPTEEIPFNQERRIEITLSDHRITPNLIEVEQHTKVTFVIKNVGKELHEFAIGYYGVEEEDVKPGEVRELTLVLLDAGEFETACHIPGHYEVGMHGMLKVKPTVLKKSNP